MPRSTRIEYPGAQYHVTARGVQQGAIFVDDRDRGCLLAILARTLAACEARAFAFCLMGNHYHFVLQTRQANPSVLMHRVNSLYSLTFNRRHGRRGHVFEGRFKALHVDRDAYLMRFAAMSISILSARALWHRQSSGHGPAFGRMPDTRLLRPGSPQRNSMAP